MVLRISGNPDLTAVCEDLFSFGDGFFGVVGSFGVDIGLEDADDVRDVGLLKDDNVIDALEGRDKRDPVLESQNRAARTFEFSDRGVAVEGHDEDVTEFTSRIEVADVPDMQHVEAAVRQDDPFILDQRWQLSNVVEFHVRVTRCPRSPASAPCA